MVHRVHYPPLGDGGKLEIKVSDNGNGIPQKVMDKIFQPFFTTKPTGQGTGLGLSLSYDIVKAHGGEIKVETKEAEGSEFIILIPNTEIVVWIKSSLNIIAPGRKIKIEIKLRRPSFKY